MSARRRVQVEQAARHDGTGGGVLDVVRLLGRAVVPHRHVVRGQRSDGEVGEFARGVPELLVPGPPVHRGEAVDAPGLSARPAGGGAVALHGIGADGGAGVRVEVEHVRGGSVRAGEDALRGPRVLDGDVQVGVVAGLPARERQQIEVHHRVHDDAARVGAIRQRAPGPDELAARVVPLDQGVGGPYRARTPFVVAGQAPGGDPGGVEEEPEVVRARVRLPGGEVPGRLDRPGAEGVVLAVQPGHPQRSGPEAAHPVPVARVRPLLELGPDREARHTGGDGTDLLHGVVRRRAECPQGRP